MNFSGFASSIYDNFIDVYLEKIQDTTDPNSSFYGEKGHFFIHGLTQIWNYDMPNLAGIGYISLLSVDCIKMFWLSVSDLNDLD